MKTLYTTILLFASFACLQAQCFLTGLNVTVGPCQGATNSYKVYGDVSFINAPSNGILLVSVDDGVTLYDTIINLPFNSPTAFSISGMPSNGNAIQISTVFSDDLACVLSTNSTAPASCLCLADAGTFVYQSDYYFGATHYVAQGNDFSIISNLDHTFASEVNTGFGPAYDTSFAYLAFSCMPSTPTTPYSDPCFSGLVGYGSSLNVNCNSSSLLSNPFYIQPITMYGAGSNVYSSTIDPAFPCFDLGLVQEVYCLGPIVAIVTNNPVTGEISIDISGGLPAINGSFFTISSVWPVGSNGGVTSVAQNGSLLLSGLLNGDQYALTITDDAGGEALVSNMYVSLEDNFQSQISLYPNPINDQLIIKEIKEPTEVSLTTSSGQVVMKQLIIADDIISTSYLPNGIYIFSATSEHGTFVQKVIK